MAIHFKFRSAVEYDSIDIDGPFISIGSLKEKIVEHKNLGRATDFDLLITNAQTAEEYTDDSFLLPKNTSVIIKRVPASRSKPVLRVEEQAKNHGSMAESMAGDNNKGAETPSQAPAISNAGMDSLDDFGVDLYAVPEPVASKIDLDENTRIAAMLNTTATEWQRQTQEGLGGGRGSGRGGYGRGGAARGGGSGGGGARGFGRATPPQGYVCHRCGQPGHFIQHCPTNGDPTYDMRKMKPPVGIPKTRLKADQEGSYILPDGSVAVMQPDESVFAKEADALLAIRPIYLEPPPELKCPLCSNIFKDAVMIPCCQYSFCDKCIRDELIAKGKCPQCESTKFKNDDLLPNINLRQAIDRFLEAQMTTSGASDSFYRQQLPDVDSGPRKVATPAASRLQIELRKPVSSAGAPVQAPPIKEVENMVVVEDVVESSKDKNEKNEQGEGSAVIPAGEDSGGAIEGPPSKEQAAETSGKEEVGLSLKEEQQGFVNDEGDTGMISKHVETLSVKETDGVAVESEVSKGKKKKKRARPVQADGGADNAGGGKIRKGTQGERVCYLCGSPDHIARDCMDHGGPGPYGPHPGMFGPGMPPMGVPPYGAGYGMEWHGPPMHPHGGPFGYGEGMHGPGPGPMPFDRPMMPGPGYGPPFGMPPMYPGVPHPGGYMRNGPGMMGVMDRPPMTREEFLEVQERQLQERHRQHRMMDHSEREWSPEPPYSRDREGKRHQSPEVENRRYKETRERRSDHDDHVRKHDPDRESGDDYSDDAEYRKPKSGSSRAERKRAPDRALDRAVADSRHTRRSHLSNDDDVTSHDELKPRRPARRDEKVPEVRRERERREYTSDQDRHDREGSRSQKSRSSRMESNSKRVNESRYRSSKRDVVPEDPEPPPETQDLRLKLGRKRERERERQERRHHGYDDAEVEESAKVEETEKPKYKRHHSRSKSKGEEPVVGYDSEDSKRKQKRKHRKHYEDSLGDRATALEDVEPVTARKSKSKNASANSIEVTRWQLVDSELDEGHSSHSYHAKRKSQRSYRS